MGKVRLLQMCPFGRERLFASVGGEIKLSAVIFLSVQRFHCWPGKEQDLILHLICTKHMSHSFYLTLNIYSEFMNENACVVNLLHGLFLFYDCTISLNRHICGYRTLLNYVCSDR